MNLQEDIKPVTYLKTKTADILNQIGEHQRPLIITQNGEAKAVLQDIRSYEATKNALGTLKLLASAEDDLKNGRVQPQDELFSELEKSLA